VWRDGPDAEARTTGRPESPGNLGPLLLAGGGLPTGRGIGPSPANGCEPTDNPVARRSLVGTLLRTLFDGRRHSVPPRRQRRVAGLIAESDPITRLKT
jgi:hypothetical protein